MGEPQIGIAFIGAGTVAEMHARGVAAHGRSKLVGVFDPHTAKARGLTERFGGKIYECLEDALSDDQVDAVHVLTPPDYHVETAVAALKAGKHVLVEKPVAWHLSDLHRLEQAAREADRVCMPAHNYIYAPSVWRMKRLVEGHCFGRISSLWVLYNIFHSEETATRYGGVLRAVCVHHAYSLLYLLGRPRSVVATVSSLHYVNLSCEDQAMLTCEMPDGALANLWSSFAAKDLTSNPWTMLYKVLGTEGGASYSWDEVRVEDNRGPGWDFPYYEEGFSNEISHFVDRCILRREAPLSTLADAADALRIVEAAERSASRGGAREVIPYE